MSWETFTPDHVKARLAAAELAAYEAQAAAEGEAEGDRLAEIVSQVAEEFRGAILANPFTSYQGAAGTLPGFCIGPAAVIARTAIVANLPLSDGATELRRDEHRDARRFLESLRTAPGSMFGEDPTDSPETGVCYGGAAKLDF